MIKAALRFATCFTLVFGVLTVHAQTQTHNGTGGKLDAPVTVGTSISVTGVIMDDGAAASFTCPITFFGFGTYQWNWSCAGGTLKVDGHPDLTVSGTMKRTCSGGGRAHPTTCFDVFIGETVNGPLYATSKGGTTTGVKETIENVVGFQTEY